MLKACFILLGLILAGDVAAATRLIPHAFPTQVVWYFNPANCEDSVLDNTRAAFDLWERLLVIDIEYGGEVTLAKADDNISVVGCTSANDFRAIGDHFAATTVYSNKQDVAVSFDIVLQAGISNCELHEVSHALGLGHDMVSDPLHSIMIGCDFADFPTTQELQIMSAIYNVKPDCTPVLNTDHSFFIPNLNGKWYRGEWTGTGWIVADFGANATDDFTCAVRKQDGHIRGEYFNSRHQAYLDFDIYQVNGEWKPWVSSGQ